MAIDSINAGNTLATAALEKSSSLKLETAQPTNKNTYGAAYSMRAGLENYKIAEQAAKQASKLNVKPSGSGVVNFAGMVKNTLDRMKDKIHKAEKTSVQRTVANQSLEELTVAMAEAEIHVQAIRSMHERIVNALQEILRIPI